MNRSTRNRTLTVDSAEQATLARSLLRLRQVAPTSAVLDQIICQDVRDILVHLPDGFVDLLVLPVAVKQVLWREVLLTEGTDCPCFERKEGE